MQLIVEDKSKIRDIEFLYPTLMSNEAKTYIIQMYQELLDIEDKLNEARELVRTLENKLRIKKDNFNSLDSICKIKFDSKESNIVDKVTVNLAVVNPTDASNKNYGV